MRPRRSLLKMRPRKRSYLPLRSIHGLAEVHLRMRGMRLKRRLLRLRRRERYTSHQLSLIKVRPRQLDSSPQVLMNRPLPLLLLHQLQQPPQLLTLDQPQPLQQQTSKM